MMNWRDIGVSIRQESCYKSKKTSNLFQKKGRLITDVAVENPEKFKIGTFQMNGDWLASFGASFHKKRIEALKGCTNINDQFLQFADLYVDFSFNI